jgi:hypothetical protein
MAPVQGEERPCDRALSGGFRAENRLPASATQCALVISTRNRGNIRSPQGVADLFASVSRLSAIAPTLL